MHTFQTPGRTTLVVRSGAGHVTVTAADTDVTSVELTALNSLGEDAVGRHGRGAAARLGRRRRPPAPQRPVRQGPAVAVVISCPTGTHLQVKAESADIRATGRFGDSTLSAGPVTSTSKPWTGPRR